MCVSGGPVGIFIWEVSAHTKGIGEGSPGLWGFSWKEVLTVPSENQALLGVLVTVQRGLSFHSRGCAAGGDQEVKVGIISDSLVITSMCLYSQGYRHRYRYR